MDKDYIKNGERMGREIITSTDQEDQGCNASFLKVRANKLKVPKA